MVDSTDLAVGLLIFLLGAGSFSASALLVSFFFLIGQYTGNIFLEIAFWIPTVIVGIFIFIFLISYITEEWR